tara:strand:+ start:180 stop:431 length:252 start_codon:yes stop_codon:yes gene_type:complete
MTAQADRVRYEAILFEQREARAALAESGAGPRPLTSHQFQLAMWLADLVIDEILSFGGAGPASASNGTSGVGSDAARTLIDFE